MTRSFVIGYLLLGVVLQDGAAFARKPATVIALSMAADGTCQARINGQTVSVTQEELDVKLPILLPDRKGNLHLDAGPENMPYRCIGQLIYSLQRAKYNSISFTAEPPPLGPEITSPGAPAQ